MKHVLSREEREYLHNVVKRMDNIIELRIDDEKLEPEYVNNNGIDFKLVDVKTGTAKDNYLKINVHDDHWYLPSWRIPPGGAKILSYKRRDEALGLVEIEVVGGNRETGTDRRSLRFTNREQKNISLVYLEDEGYYQQYDPLVGEKRTPNQRIAEARINEVSQLGPRFLPFLFEFEDFLRAKKTFEPSHYTEDAEVERAIRTLRNVVPMFRDYIAINFIFGRIQRFERDILYAQVDFIDGCVWKIRDYWEDRNVDAIDDVFRFHLSAALRKLIIPRRFDVKADIEKLRITPTFTSFTNILESVGGYIYDAKTHKIARSLLEVPRNYNRTEEFSSQVEEDLFSMLLSENLEKFKPDNL